MLVAGGMAVLHHVPDHAPACGLFSLMPVLSCVFLVSQKGDMNVSASVLAATKPIPLPRSAISRPTVVASSKVQVAQGPQVLPQKLQATKEPSPKSQVRSQSCNQLQHGQVV